MSNVTPPSSANASGWSVYLHHDGRWQWSAFSRGGSTYGWALTKAEAEQRAQAEAEHLKRHFPHQQGWPA